MDDPVEFFLTEAIAHARTLPMAKSVVFLRGLLQSCGDDKVADQIRRIYIPLSESDRQLELIATKQLKLKLGAE
jgi:hypothetical protein